MTSFKVISQNLPGGTEENNETTTIRSPDRDLVPSPPDVFVF
jgi:hypothetical protein